MASLLKQVNQMINLIAQRNPSEWDLQGLIESGLISDLLLLTKEDVLKIDRQAFRKFIGLETVHTVSIPANPGIDGLIKLCEPYCDPNGLECVAEVRKAGFKVPCRFYGHFDAHLLLPGRPLSTPKVKRYIQERGLRPAIAAELLAFVACYPRLDFKGRNIVALGSTGADGGFLAFAGGPESGLEIEHPEDGGAIWHEQTSFLAVRTPERGGPRYQVNF